MTAGVAATLCTSDLQVGAQSAENTESLLEASRVPGGHNKSDWLPAGSSGLRQPLQGIRVNLLIVE